MKILIIEDNKDLAMALQEALSKSYICDIVMRGEDGIRMATRKLHDLVILDVGLPDMSGLDVCRDIRRVQPNLPIILLTGKYISVADKVMGLDGGADDYLVKPVDVSELLARIRALLRRPSTVIKNETIEYGDIAMNTMSRIVTRSGKPIQLRRKEFDLLEYFLRNPDRVLTRDMIMNRVWGSDVERFTNAVDVHVKYLRDKIDKPFPKQYIETVFGLGYKLR